MKKFFGLIILGILLATNCFAYQIINDPVVYENGNSYLKALIIGVSDLELIKPSFICSAANSSYPRVVYGYENEDKKIVKAIEFVEGKDLRLDNCELVISNNSTKLTTLKPPVVTSLWATLKGRLEKYSGKTKVTFKIWKRTDGEPQLDLSDYRNRYKSKDFLNLSTSQEFTYNTRFYSFFDKKLTPNEVYCYRAIAIDDLQNGKVFEADNASCFKTRAFNSLGTNELEVPFFSQSDPRWGWHFLNNNATFDSDGCLNTDIAMIVKYWYDRDPVIQKNWEAMYKECIANHCPNSNDSAFTITGKSPNPYSVHWVGTYYSGGLDSSWNYTAPWKKLGLVPKSIPNNDAGNIREWYLARGVPVIFMCMPSFFSGGIRHYGVILGFYSDKPFQDSKGKFLNYMIINDPAKYTEETGKVYFDVNNYVFSTGIPHCGHPPAGSLILAPGGTPPYSEGLSAVYPIGFKMDGFTSYPNQ